MREILLSEISNKELIRTEQQTNRIELMKRYIILVLSISLISCANLIGNVSSGFYTSAGSEFKVKTPAIPKLSIQDGVLNKRVFVDFYQSRGFWKKYGLYSIEWFKPQSEIKTKKSFYRYNKNITSSFVKSNYGSRGSFNVVDSRNLKINEQLAYQFIANGRLDDVDAVWIGTSIKFDNYIALLSIVIESENDSNPAQYGATVQAKIPWNKYNDFLNSFTKLKPQ